ncbi:hypothetical protein [uncultured Aquimarina sp.]|uniref:hypothetical protein n=1 Tax=uncultured Aquimarina sp. TaxID=575652 RepID=UPI002629CE15|nr:hypothetical protein [uncultured Aquimarina sp.]
MGLTTDKLDFTTSLYQLIPVTNAEELLALLDTSWKKSKKILSNAKEDDFLPIWTIYSGDQIFMKMTKYEVIRPVLR